MSVSSNTRVLSAVALVLAGVCATSSAADAQRAAVTAADAKSQQWQASRGTIAMRWNKDLLSDLGLALGKASGVRAPAAGSEADTFELGSAGILQFEVRNGNLRAFTGGSLQARGGYVVEAPGGRIDLTNFTLRPRLGSATILDVVGADGKSWFYVDRLMYELIDRQQRLAVRTMDLRITPELAARIGQPLVEGWAVADIEMITDVLRQGQDAAPLAGPFKWHGEAVPGVPGATYQADLFMSAMSFQYSRCNGCTGVGGNGQAVFTPSSTLRNNVNNGSLQPTVAGDPLGTSQALYAADIPWWQKFSGSNPPYNNDQHPFLIWNLYRLNADGTIDQVGRSGVKHAFLTLNTSCLDNPGSSHVLGRGCSDVYSVGNNDNNDSMGPRSEIIPATNQWGRCGSIYDTNCDGIANGTPNGSYDQRLVVRESQFSGVPQNGATYLFESWYLAREDVDITNSMATKQISFARSGSVWVVGGNTQYRLGPAIDRWVEPGTRGTNASSSELVTAEGRVKLAARATDLGGGRWRYDYAVMNLDFARAQTQGAEPNLRVLSNAGFDAFTIPIGSATITDLVFSDGDEDASNDWTPSIGGGNVTWTSANSSNPLNWGTMFRFSFITDKGPGPVRVSVNLKVANAGAPQVLEVTGQLSPVTARNRR
ncbi:MAG: hypothetical protein ABIN96_16765 [Rubrivivax sp.]